MGVENHVRMMFYCQCPKCHHAAAVNVDQVRSSEVMQALIQFNSYCFAVECSICKSAFVATIGDAQKSTCGMCVARENCIQAGSAPLQWIDLMKRQILDINY